MKQKNNLFYGWIIVGVAAVVVFFSGPGQTYSVSIFIDHYIREFGWSRTAISSYYSIATLVSGLSLPVIGRFIDNKGHRKSLMMITVLFSVTCVWMSFVMSPWMILVGFVFVRMFGQGSMTLIASVLVPQWFIRQRGRALSLIAVGSIVSSALLPPLNQKMIDTRGASFTWLLWSTLLIMVMLPIAIRWVRNKPEDLGLLPDGDTYKETNGHELEWEGEVSWTLLEATKTRSFWFMLFCMFVPAMVNTGMTFHIISIISEKGQAITLGAYILSLSAIAQTPFNFIAGIICEKLQANYIKGINFLIYSLTIGVLIFSKDEKMLIVFAILWGVFMGFDAVSTNVLWSNYYGRRHLGKIRSITMTAMVIGSAFGPLPFGAAYDIFGGYTQVLWLMVLFSLLGSLASWLSPPPKRI